MADTTQVKALEAAGLGPHLLLRDTAEYTSALESWWSLNSRLRPICIVQPTSADQVSTVMKVIVSSNAAFAIRSGAHSPLKGGNSIDDGITIDLTHVHSRTIYNADTKVASLGPGQRWGEVLHQLVEHGVAVASGRDTNVGVGGFITGGGITYHSGIYGFVCDNLINAQVVLADGQIVEANHTTNSDLFRALKGGRATAGIVTRFDLPTIPKTDVWGGARFVGIEHADSCADHLVAFTDQYHTHPGAAYLLAITYGMEHLPELAVMQLVVNTDGSPNPEALRDALSLPAKIDDVKTRSMSSVITDYALPSGYLNIWLTLTVKNDGRIVKYATGLLAEVKTDVDAAFPPQDTNDISSFILWQGLPKLFNNNNSEKGGNVLGLDRLDGDALIFQYVAMCKTPEQELLLRSKGQKLIDEVKTYSKSIARDIDWLYVNYSDTTQNPLAAYGQQNVDFLKAVAQKYDPNGVFQKLAASSFHVSKS